MNIILSDIKMCNTSAYIPNVRTVLQYLSGWLTTTNQALPSPQSKWGGVREPLSRICRRAASKLCIV